jgi:hypothetical protein
MLGEVMAFTPDVIIFDRPMLADMERDTFEGVHEIAAKAGAELWMSCRTHREGPQGEPGHLPPPADRFEDLIDLAFRLEPQDAKVRLQVAKDRGQSLDRDLNIQLDPQTLLLGTGVGARR